MSSPTQELSEDRLEHLKHEATKKLPAVTLTSGS
ncbi:MAG: hypothetical protein QOH46_68 [Solirubrobacteraceae bacterium]|nr:hypothetical protein [Solirubrobacteraceae bacterium]